MNRQLAVNTHFHCIHVVHTFLCTTVDCFYPFCCCFQGGKVAVEMTPFDKTSEATNDQVTPGKGTARQASTSESENRGVKRKILE